MESFGKIAWTGIQRWMPPLWALAGLLAFGPLRAYGNGVPARTAENGGIGTNRYALCVGINHYKAISSLSGCVNDARYFATNLVSRGGWPCANITLLTDSRATKAAIRNAIQSAAAKAVPGDIFVYQQSSHGGQANAADGGDPLVGENGKAVYLCVYDEDADDNATAYNDHELAADLSAFRAGVKVVVVVDACHSGGLFKNAARAKSAAPAFPLAERVTAFMDARRTARKARGDAVSASISSSEIGWATAAEYHETSWDGGFYHSDAWLSDPAYGDGYWSYRTQSYNYPPDYKPGGIFLASATWAWWNGTADGDAEAGDRDGFCDVYEFWKQGHDFASRLGTFWGDAEYAFHPQCTNVGVLKSVELGVSGASETILPAAPADVVVSTNRTDGIRLSWSGGSGAASFHVWRGTSSTRSRAAKVMEDVVSPCLDTSPALVAGRKYHYWIEAENPSGSAFSSGDWGVKDVALDLDAAATSMAAAGGNGGFSVSANAPWSAVGNANWIRVTAPSGSGDGMCSFTVASNGGANARTGRIVVTAGDGTPFPKSVTHTVTQAGTLSPVADTVWRFYSKNYKGHFFTISEQEKDALVSENPNWECEGGAFRAYKDPAEGTVALHRFYSKNYRGHFFTVDEDEMWTVRNTNPNWRYEGVAFYVHREPVEGSVPVFRFWSKAYRHHFYTASGGERDGLIAANPNWKYETIAFWALPPETETSPTRSAQATKRAASERTATARKTASGAQAPARFVEVTTSDGTDGSAVADGDASTAWSPAETGDCWVVLSFGEALDVADVDVSGTHLPAGTRVLLSEDATNWTETSGGGVRYVWVAFPSAGKRPEVREITVRTD